MAHLSHFGKLIWPATHISHLFPVIKGLQSIHLPLSSHFCDFAPLASQSHAVRNGYVEVNCPYWQLLRLMNCYTIAVWITMVPMRTFVTFWEIIIAFSTFFTFLSSKIRLFTRTYSSCRITIVIYSSIFITFTG